MRVTQHRFHCNNATDPFPSVMDYDSTHPIYQFYYSIDCPGVDNPDSRTPLPVIDTLLSIPFSLLHNLPRLCAMVPITRYQRQLITLGTQIIHLWYWDPPPHMIARSVAIRTENQQQNDVPNSKPYPIQHPSRNFNYIDDDIISDAEQFPSFGTLTPCSIRDKHTIKRSVGPIFLSIPTFAPGTDENHEMQVTVTDEISLMVTDVLFDGEDNGLTNHGALMADITGSPVTSSETEDLDNSGISGNVKAVEDKSPLEDIDIVSWYQKVVDSEPEPASLGLIPTPFKRGLIGSMSVNDILMARGLISPTVYIQFIDLSSFHHDTAHV